jgi:hypothetical protein
MGDVIQFRRPKASKEHRGSMLCRSDFHDWEVVKERQFDVKQGRLVTLLRCKRCGKTKIRGL